MVTSYNLSLAVFTCLPGHTMSGTDTLGCVDGTHWNGTVPHCVGTKHMSDQPLDGTTTTSDTAATTLSYPLMWGLGLWLRH